MSGPKLSAAEIEENRKRQLKIERENRIKRLIQAQENYDMAVKGAMKTANEIWDCLEQSGSASWSNDLLEEIQNLLVKLIKELQVGEYPNAASAEEWNKETNNLKRKIQEVKKTAIKEIESVREREKLRKQTADTNQINTADEAVINTNDTNKKPQNTTYISVDKVLFRSPKKVQRMMSMLDALISDISDFETGKNAIQLDLHKLKEQAVNMKDQLSTQISVDVDLPCQREVQNLVDEFILLKEQRKNQDALYRKYKALCEILGKEKKKYHEFADNQELTKCILKYEEEYSEVDEMGYIADSINEVMQELGYSCVGSHLLYKQDGEQDCSVYQDTMNPVSGITVYTGTNGEVMMRVASLTTDDTAGEFLFDGDLTDEERDVSLEQQILFCRLHPEIVRALYLRGIILKQINYLPPERNSAMKVTVDSNMEKKSVSRRRSGEGNEKMSEMQ